MPTPRKILVLSPEEKAFMEFLRSTPQERWEKAFVSDRQALLEILLSKQEAHQIAMRHYGWPDQWKDWQYDIEHGFRKAADLMPPPIDIDALDADGNRLYPDRRPKEEPKPDRPFPEPDDAPQEFGSDEPPPCDETLTEAEELRAIKWAKTKAPLYKNLRREAAPSEYAYSLYTFGRSNPQAMRVLQAMSTTPKVSKKTEEQIEQEKDYKAKDKQIEGILELAGYTAPDPRRVPHEQITKGASICAAAGLYQLAELLSTMKGAGA